MDLSDDKDDVSFAADALRDAVRGKHALDETRLAELLDTQAERLGRTPNDARGALAFLMAAAEVDAVSKANRALDQVLTSTIPLPRIAVFINKLESNLPTLASRATAAVFRAEGAAEKPRGYIPHNF